MIGNDVVDILQSRIESNWQRRGLLQKLFTDDEQLLIKNAKDPEIMLWLLWSMKEAAYKIYNRQTKIRAYIPKKLTCTLLVNNKDSIMGHVTCYEYSYITKTTLMDNVIHTVAVTSQNDLQNITLAEYNDIVKDMDGIPHVYCNKKRGFKDVSVSHHGDVKKAVTLATY